MNIDQVLPTFIAESRELLDEMEQQLLSLSDQITTEDKSEKVNAIFRAMHTIKGSAGLFGFDHIVKFTHVLENLLDEVRNGKVNVTEGLTTLLLLSCDHVSVMIDALVEGKTTEDEALSQQGALLLKELINYSSQKALAEESKTVERIHSVKPDHNNWHISLRFNQNILKNGMDPLACIRYLSEFGEVIGIFTVIDLVPLVNAIDPELCYLGFEINFKTTVDKSTIESAFEFVKEGSIIHIVPPSSQISEYIRLINEFPEEAARLGEMLMRCGTVTEYELKTALQKQANTTDNEQPIGEILVEQGAVEPVVVEAALLKQKQVNKTQETPSVRVDAQRLDHLITLIGELITIAARTRLIANDTCSEELDECSSILSSLVEEVHDNALQLRMVKIGVTFNRFQRVVYDVSKQLGKDISLVITGEETELDKTVIEKITDPLTHLIRNSIDHGIESPEVRLNRNKLPKGKISLNAYHDSGSVVIEVSDDGGGLNREKILNKAIEKGLVKAGQNLTENEIYDLIFEPGFSTSDTITNLSGRGVGMDVVKSNIKELRGNISLNSKEGKGTIFTIRLPLTLAIIDGLLVSLGQSMFVIPLESVEECVEFTNPSDRDYIDLRGHVLPFIRLNELFSIEKSDSYRENIIVIKQSSQRFGLVVDELHGQFQTIIKPLSSIFSNIQGIGGSSILGNGKVALILDIPALIKNITHRQSSKITQTQS